MTVSILASRGLGSDTRSRALPIVVQPHSRRAAVSRFEPLLVALSLVLFARLRGGGRHAETRVTASVPSRTRQFLREWWPHLAVLAAFAVVTIVGVLVLSVQVPR